MDPGTRCEETLSPEALTRILGFETPYFETFKTVFMHADAAVLHDTASYDRFEFLGDAVINLLCARFLFEKFPDADEGFLTRSRSKLVCTKALAELSVHLGLPRYVVVTSKAFEANEQRLACIAEDLFEALIGCVYETHGLLNARAVFLGALDAVQAPRNYACLFQDNNYKNAMVVLSHAANVALPSYHVIPPREGSARGFKVKCMYAGNREGGVGFAAKKKDAEQLAAKATLGMFGLLDAEGFVRPLATKAQLRELSTQAA